MAIKFEKKRGKRKERAKSPKKPKAVPGWMRTKQCRERKAVMSRAESSTVTQVPNLDARYTRKQYSLAWLYFFLMLTPFLISVINPTTQESYSHRGEMQLYHLNEFNINVCTRWYSIGSNPFWYSLYTSIHPIMFFVFHCYRSNNLTQNQCTYNTDSIGTKPGCTAATSPTPMYVQTISNEIELTLMFTNTNMYLVSYLYSQ